MRLMSRGRKTEIQLHRLHRFWSCDFTLRASYFCLRFAQEKFGSLGTRLLTCYKASYIIIHIRSYTEN